MYFLSSFRLLSSDLIQGTRLRNPECVQLCLDLGKWWEDNTNFSLKRDTGRSLFAQYFLIRQSPAPYVCTFYYELD